MALRVLSPSDCREAPRRSAVGTSATDMTPEQFTAAVELYSSNIRKLLIKRGATHSDAEEITQETWFRAWAHRDQWRGGNLKAWLCAIALNTQRTHWKFQSRFCELPTHDQEQAPSQLKRMIYLDNFERRIEAWQILSRCSPRSARILYGAHFLGERSNGVGKLRMRLFHALKEARGVARRTN